MSELLGLWRVRLPDGTEFEWDPDDVTPGEESMILGELLDAGINDYDAWLRAIDRRDGTARQVLVWFLRRKRGEQVDRQSVIFAHRKLLIEAVGGDADPEAGAGAGSTVEISAPAS